MNIIGAMRDTVALARKRLSQDEGSSMAVSRPDFAEAEPGCDLDHLKFMLERMEAGTMSDTKMCRWLGYAQGVLVARGIATLSDMKQVSKRHAD